MKPRTDQQRYAGRGPYVNPGQLKRAVDDLLKRRPGRLPDFAQRFQGALLNAEHRRFFYGACVQLAAECTDAVTGSSWTEQIRPLYTDESQARALVAPPGALEQMVTARLGLPIPMSEVLGCDVVLMSLQSGLALGIFAGAQGIACAAMPRGITCVDRSQGLKAWKVG